MPWDDRPARNDTRNGALKSKLDCLITYKILRTSGMSDSSMKKERTMGGEGYGQVIQIEEERIQGRLSAMVRGTGKETRTRCWMRSRIGFAGRCAKEDNSGWVGLSVLLGRP
jgi:hypothetical protein